MPSKLSETHRDIGHRTQVRVLALHAADLDLIMGHMIY